MNNSKNIILLLGLTISFHIFAFGERITTFKSDITVAPDASLLVKETITAIIERGKHGLVRDFPTIYHDRYNIRHTVDFTIQSIKKDGRTVPYNVYTMINGKRILIGDAHATLPGGTYEYELIYSTNRQIGFFETHDELYWNVTGNGWKLPIEVVQATVHVPNTVKPSAIAVEAYTGSQGAHQKNYRAQVGQGAYASWQTTTPLMPYEGLTIVMSWPKGHVQQPTWFDNFVSFVKDNVGIFWLIMGIIALIVYCFTSWRRINKEQNAGTVIPLFYPPKDLTPGQTRYLANTGYDDKVFAAEILQLAVHGYITIEHKSTFFSKYYILKKTGNGDTAIAATAQPLMDRLFGRSDTLEIAQANHSILLTAIDNVKKRFSKLDHYFEYHANECMLAVLIAAITVIGFLLLGGASSQIEYLYIGLVPIICILFMYCTGVKGYTKTGQKLRDDIEGFKLFLAITETERFTIIGTPPTRTPELYEKYLPYAVALGVESQWSAQFAPIFAQFAQQGNPYVPLWYIGNMHNFSSQSFATNLGNSLNTAITQSTMVSSSGSTPGSSSGSGGGGSSGGGGGGGGGGTW